ncbi:hypothetical protein QA640_29205 [Bradyrhizobium sp. CB82]|nr:hypothetical protein [Bradyrhizobium sp. CB82]WFU38487.1 hypothetical protein QA640_29205 [Bradyrhizobium sp. CB82]
MAGMTCASEAREKNTLGVARAVERALRKPNRQQSAASVKIIIWPDRST